MLENLKNNLSDDALEAVEGGALPFGWQFVIKNGISTFKNTPDSEIAAQGYTKDADGMIKYLLNSGLVEEYNLNDADIETVKAYIYKNY